MVNFGNIYDILRYHLQFRPVGEQADGATAEGAASTGGQAENR